MKLLIADDNAQNRYLLEQLLTLNGHEAVAVNNGAEALARLRAETFDACISDVLMPVMDGFHLCRALKAAPETATIPIIFYTATYTEPADAAFGLRLGATHYIVKPADPQTILQALRNLGGAKAAEPFVPPADDDYLTQYNARLVRKLESKMLDLERANASLLKTNLALGDEISRRRRAEKAAQAGFELHRATLESTLDGILAVDADGSIVAANRAFSRLWGLAPAEKLPATFAGLIEQLRRLGTDAASATAWENAAARPESATVDVVLLANGTILERMARPLETPDGRDGRVWTFRDVTHERQAEEARRSLQAQLFALQKMEALGVLAGGIAHDFNNILTIILGQTSIADGLLADGSPAREPLANVTKAGMRAADLVRQILTFSRNQKPERQSLQLAEMVKDTIKLMQATLPAGIRIVTDLAPDLPAVLADKTQLHQVLMNLSSNAEQAMDGRGTLSFGLRRITSPEEGPPELRGGAYLLLTVRDTGPGIEEAVIHRLFEPFFTTKPQGRGTGLGLAVVHGIITSYGGHIRVVSKMGEGAEFQIYFPVVVQAVQPAAPPASTGLRRGNGELVLVAEDDAGVRGFVATLLERLNYRSVMCESAEAALEKFKERPEEFDLVLTDLSMTGMNGSQFAQQVRRVRPALPVIIMTGYFSSTELERDRAAMQFELMLKPCSASSLSEVVYRVLHLNR